MPISRRRLLSHGFYTSTGLALSKHASALGQTMASPSQVRSGVKLARYVDPLPTPSVISAIGSQNKVVDIEMRQFRQKVHRDLPPTTLWGYNGSWPGSTIETQSGQAISVNWTSKLPARHLLRVDHSIHGAESSIPEVRNVAHVHGACVLPDAASLHHAGKCQH